MNARIIGLVVGVVFAAGMAWGQPEVEWERTYDNLSRDVCYSLISTLEDGYALAGISRAGFSDPADFCIVKTDDRGTQLWTKSFGSPQNDDVCYDLVQTGNGEFALGGNTYSYGEGENDFWMLIVDEDGDSLSSHTYGAVRADYCNAMIQTVDDGFALAGSRWYWVGENWPPRDSANACLIKTDPNGTTEWVREYRASEFMSLTQTNDGGFALIGNNGLGLGAVTIFRVNSQGDSLWSTPFEADEVTIVYDIIETRDRGFAVIGRTGHGERDHDLLLLKLNSDGEILWSRTYGGAGNTDVGRSIRQTPDGGYAMAGYTYSFGAGDDNGWLIRVNADGDSLWSLPCGGNGSDDFMSLVITPDSGYAMAGQSGGDFYLVKTTPDPVSVREPHSTLSPLTFKLFPAFPNPFNSTVTIPFGLDESAPTRLAIFDPLGRRVADLTGRFGDRPYAGNHSVVWNANGMPAGQYIIRLEAGNQQLTQRLSLVK